MERIADLVTPDVSSSLSTKGFSRLVTADILGAEMRPDRLRCERASLSAKALLPVVPGAGIEWRAGRVKRHVGQYHAVEKDGRRESSVGRWAGWSLLVQEQDGVATRTRLFYAQRVRVEKYNSRPSLVRKT